MKIEIKLDEKQSDMNRSDLQAIRRMINVLLSRGFDVELDFKDGDKHNNDDEYDLPYMGGKHPHQGYLIKMVKDTNKKLDAPNYKTIYNKL